MHIQDRRALKAKADSQLARYPHAQQVLVIYFLISTALAFGVSFADDLLNLQIDKFGGLSNMGTKSLLSTFQTVLMLAGNVAQMCLELGFLGIALRIARGIRMDAHSLKVGFQRLWSLMLCYLIQSGIYLMVALVLCYAAALIFTMSPLSADFMALITSGAVDMTGAPAPETMLQILDAMKFMFVIYFILLAVVMIPLTYSFRLSQYLILDRPGASGLGVLMESRKLMRGHRMDLFRLDLNMIGYHILCAAASLLLNATMLASLLNIQLPFTPLGNFYLFYVAYHAVIFGVFWFFRNKVEVTYALAYETLLPKPEETKGVVLGNIFQM